MNFKFNSHKQKLLFWYLARYTFFWEVESGLFGIFDLNKALKSPDFFVARAKEFENQILVEIMHLRHGCTHLPALTLAVPGTHLAPTYLHPPWQGWTSWKSHPPVQSHSNPHDAKLYLTVQMF